MKFQSVRIKNLRPSEGMMIPFDAVTTIIGRNGAGTSRAKNQLAYWAATPEAAGTVSEMLTQILAKAEGK